MTANLTLALVLQAGALALLRYRLGRLWLRRSVTVLVLDSVICDGVTGVMLLSRSLASQNAYRQGIGAGFTDSATLLLAACMVAYLLARPERSEPGSDHDGQAAGARHVKPLPPR